MHDDSSAIFRTGCPPCTDFTIVIPYNPSESKYDRTVYAPPMTGGRATSEEIEYVLNQLEILAKKIPSSFSMTIISFLFLVIPLIACVYFSIFLNMMGFVVMWIGLLLYFVLLTICLTLWKRLEIANAKRLAIHVIQRCQPAFQTKGLRWHIPPSFPLWVELYKDYREYAFVPPQVQHFQPMMVPQHHNIPAVNQQGYQLFNQRQGNIGMYQPPVLNQGGNQNQGYPLL